MKIICKVWEFKEIWKQNLKVRILRNNKTNSYTLLDLKLFASEISFTATPPLLQPNISFFAHLHHAPIINEPTAANNAKTMNVNHGKFYFLILASGNLTLFFMLQHFGLINNFEMRAAIAWNVINYDLLLSTPFLFFAPPFGTLNVCFC